ncbi:hypothetical protein D3C80_1627700 [compost metagenome]
MVYPAFFELPISNTDAAKETSSKRSITTEELALSASMSTARRRVSGRAMVLSLSINGIRPYFRLFSYSAQSLKVVSAAEEHLDRALGPFDLPLERQFQAEKIGHFPAIIAPNCTGYASDREW